jgi:hypothetical protein
MKVCHHCFAAVMALIFLQSARAWAGPEATLEALLSRIPAETDAEDSNFYALTDVQAAMELEPRWHPLLRRAVQSDPKSGLSFALVVGSRLGRCGAELVEWPEAPTLRRGQIYVSKGLLQTVLKHYPDYRLPGQEVEIPTPTPAAEASMDEIPEEPPAPTRDSAFQIKTLLAITLPASSSVGSGTPAASNPSRLFIAELGKILKENGIQLRSQVWDPKSPEKSYDSGSDAMVAFRIEAASPPAKASFLYYDAGSVAGDAKRYSLVEWSRVSRNRQQESRAIADLFFRNFVGAFGEKRAAGLRSGPINLLQGRNVPAVFVNLGVSPASAEEEIKKTAEVIGSSLAQIRKG